VLGSGFDHRDFAAYTAGVLAAMLLDRGLERRGDQRSRACVRTEPNGRPSEAHASASAWGCFERQCR
jgi:hypothetical protein